MTSPQLGWARPELIEAFVSFTIFQKWLVVSLRVSLPIVLVQSQPACFSVGQVKNLCVKFSSHHVKKKENVAVQNSQIEEMKKQIFPHFHA